MRECGPGRQTDRQTEAGEKQLEIAKTHPVTEEMPKGRQARLDLRQEDGLRGGGAATWRRVQTPREAGRGRASASPPAPGLGGTRQPSPWPFLQGQEPKLPPGALEPSAVAGLWWDQLPDPGLLLWPRHLLHFSDLRVQFSTDLSPPCSHAYPGPTALRTRPASGLFADGQLRSLLGCLPCPGAQALQVDACAPGPCSCLTDGI